MDLAAYGDITSIVVSRGGQVVVEEYSDGDAETLRNTRSCTKTVCGMLLGVAIRQGFVPSVHMALGELLDDVPADKQSITLRDLLTMSSCLDCNDWDVASPGNEELMYEQDDWVRFALDLPVRRDREFSYCTAGVVLLGVALEHAVGGSLPAFAAAELLEPLDIGRAEWQQTPRGETSNAGGLMLRSRSLLALGELYLRGGDGIVTPEWIAESTRPHRRIDAVTEYGYLWWLKTFNDARSFYMSGMGGNRVHVFPDRQLVAVITSTNLGRRDAHALSDRLLVEQIL
jgi:CubicO group peptidase (beta-lactamase class C family)